MSVLFIHAITRDRSDFEELAAHLAPLSPRALDLIGHGEAPRAPRYRVTDYAQAIDLPEARSVLFGHSLGGLVALCLAARSPERVRALVLEDPPLFSSRPPRFEGSSFHEGFVALRAILAKRPGRVAAEWEPAVASWPSGHGEASIGDALGPAAVRRRARQIALMDPKVLDAPIAGELNDGFEALPALAAADCPVVILAGEADKGSALSEDDLRLLAAEQNVQIVRVAGKGHYIHEVQPQRCAEIVTMLGSG